VTFDQDMDETTLNSSTVVVNGKCTGLHVGTYTYDSPSNTVTFTPDHQFAAGEEVTIVLSTDTRTLAGGPLAESRVLSFTTATHGGSGEFEFVGSREAGWYVWSVIAADLTADGHLDLAAISQDNATVYFNDGQGDFSGPAQVPGVSGRQIVAGDFNADGYIDLATDHGGGVSVSLNDQAYSFEPPVTYTVGTDPYYICVADLNGDGFLDLTATNYSDDNVSVLLNVGDGTFADQLTYDVGGAPQGTAAADLDRDGDIDLAVGNRDDHSVSVLLNDGNGFFFGRSDYDLGALNQPWPMCASDFDGDGDIDLAMGPYLSGSVENLVVIFNDGSGGFGSPDAYNVGAMPSLVTGDLDSDGDMDLASLFYHGIMFNDGNGVFVEGTPYGSPASSGQSVFAADFDEDGDLDLVNANVVNHTISIHMNLNSTCCADRVGDANGMGGDEPTIGDIAIMIDALFITGVCEGTVDCIAEADINQSGGADPVCDDITIGDIAQLIDYLFITGPSLGLPDCL
jgi:hypothetical protein